MVLHLVPSYEDSAFEGDDVAIAVEHELPRLLVELHGYSEEQILRFGISGGIRATTVRIYVRSSEPGTRTHPHSYPAPRALPEQVVPRPRCWVGPGEPHRPGSAGSHSPSNGGAQRDGELGRAAGWERVRQ